MITLIAAAAPWILSCPIAQAYIYDVDPDLLSRTQYLEVIQTIADHSSPECLLFTRDGEQITSRSEEL